MKNRRNFVLSLTAGLVALCVIIGPVIAEDFMGAITKVDPDAKKVTVATKDGDTIEVTVNDKTEIVTGKGDTVDLEKLSKQVAKAIDAGKKGAFAKISHENKVASKIVLLQGKKKADN